MELRNYQIEIVQKGLSILKQFGLVYLALEVRTGKTVTALSIAKEYGAKSILFVTKKKAISSIESDCKLIGIPSEVINFESVSKIKNIPDLVIVDEAHSISAYPKPSKRAIELKAIAYGKPIIYLSGTPTPESYSQIFHQLWISIYSPFHAYTNFYKWAKVFVNPKKMYVYNRELNDYSSAKIELIESFIKPLFITFTQSEAGFEQKIEERFLTVKMQDSTYSLAKKILKDRVYESTNGSVILADTEVKLQSKLHQIYSGTVKDENGNSIVFDRSKAIAIKEKFSGKKIAIYYKFIGECNILKEVFENWTDDPLLFQSEIDKVFIGQFISSREGIRLDTADYIIFYNIDFAFLSYEQAKNRIISKERTKQAILYWVFSDWGIESRIYKAVSNKKDYTNYYFKKDYGIRKQETKKIDN